MSRFLFRNFEKNSNSSNKRDSRNEALLVLSDFYLEWQEILNDYKILTRTPDTEENIYFETMQKEEMTNLLADAFYCFQKNDGEMLTEDIRKMVRELKQSNLPNYIEMLLPKIVVSFKRHMKEFVEYYGQIENVDFDKIITPDEARKMLENEIGVDRMDYEEISMKDGDFAEFNAFANQGVI